MELSYILLLLQYCVHFCVFAPIATRLAWLNDPVAKLTWSLGELSSSLHVHRRNSALRSIMLCTWWRMKVVSTFSVIYESTRILCELLLWIISLKSQPNWQNTFVLLKDNLCDNYSYFLFPLVCLSPIIFLSLLSVFFCECLLSLNFCSKCIKSK